MIIVQIIFSDPLKSSSSFRVILIMFPALSVYPRVGISLSASETDDRFLSSKFGTAACVPGKVKNRMFDP